MENKQIPLIEIENLTRWYPNDPSLIFQNFNFKLYPNEFKIILWKSWVWKTTLTKLLLRQLKPLLKWTPFSSHHPQKSFYSGFHHLLSRNEVVPVEFHSISKVENSGKVKHPKILKGGILRNVHIKEIYLISVNLLILLENSPYFFVFGIVRGGENHHGRLGIQHNGFIEFRIADRLKPFKHHIPPSL